ncbi:hypothetical protein OUZ56_012701 [Daphnia magna]|uniref:Uncharacterized protein n=1 Tax=Daphnia magna TaxID=35525 RepID=A0ABQ9Z3S7_9CRUS|nr:hypothetical protein OUZ56_012701 [Daphnia magna]
MAQHQSVHGSRKHRQCDPGPGRWESGQQENAFLDPSPKRTGKTSKMEELPSDTKRARLLAADGKRAVAELGGYHLLGYVDLAVAVLRLEVGNHNYLTPHLESNTNLQHHTQKRYTNAIYNDVNVHRQLKHKLNCFGTFGKSRNYGRMPGGVKGTLKVKKGRGEYFFIRKGAFDEGDQGERRCFCRPILSKTMLISANPVTCIGEPD